jgi:hypothetical protein
LGPGKEALQKQKSLAVLAVMTKQLHDLVCKTYSAFYKLDYMLETPKALSTPHDFNMEVKILKILFWTISRKPKDL